MEFKAKADGGDALAEGIEAAETWGEVPLTFNGETIGTATVDRDGTVTGRIYNEKAKEMGLLPDLGHFAIGSKLSLRDLWRLREMKY